ncbi:Transcriptional regulator, MarR family [Fulvivirga imtechensis AK7]|uniref:Transcriptional regulator, MarR family n=1 Tax=Fulvivirga imtechensis AK7 TaxID=1237149 RepID=L8JHY5_9BACT|nr:MarR family winged helix-turn-helix transcriptional regulator [Fulvivirga imtechensis]ELR68481.1 Transcriptional regulator, MarR family [Fulvivirga imtechensis AK7]
MGISEDIKQKQFQSEHHKALINLIYTHNHVINEMNIFFKSIDITRQQYNVLRILRGQYPNSCSINLIKERMLDKMSDASRIVQRLSVKGLVDRENSDHDRRAVEVTISKNGLNLLTNTDEKVRDFSHLLENLDHNEAKLLNTLLDKIRIAT